jgi:peptide deformylase
MIIKDPDKRLHTPTTDCIGPTAKQVHKLLLAEVKVATEQQKEKGNIVVGLAAPQLGILKAAFTAFGRVFINPEIAWRSEDKIESREGCLSLGDDEVHTKQRSRIVNLRWHDKARQLHQSYFNDDAAVVVQHEMDHLKGVMCND